jgi:hypothetical protein
MRKKEDRTDSETEEHDTPHAQFHLRSFSGAGHKSAMGNKRPVEVSPIQDDDNDDVISDSVSKQESSDSESSSSSSGCSSDEDIEMVARESTPPPPCEQPKKSGSGTSKSSQKKRKASPEAEDTATPAEEDDDDEGGEEEDELLGSGKKCNGGGNDDAENVCSNTGTHHKPLVKQPAPKKAKTSAVPSHSPSNLRLPLCRKVSDMVYRQVVPIGKLLEAVLAGGGKDRASSCKGAARRPPKRTSFIFTEDDALRVIVKRVVRDFPSFRDEDRAKELVGKFLTILYDETHSPIPA